MNKITGIKDLDLYILQNLDDRSVLNFLSASKDLNTDENFALIFGKRYPQLLKFKRPDESIKGLYLRMLKYIRLLGEEFRIVYTKEEKENPIFLYAFKKYGIRDLNSLLIGASQNGDLEVVKYSLEEQTDADIREKASLALKFASEYGHLPIVQYVIEKGANISTQDDYALRWASYNGHLPVVKYLVEKGADIHTMYYSLLRSVSRERHLPVVEYLKSVIRNKKTKKNKK